MAIERVTRFELHIRPLMRLLDRDEMISRFDLWDYDRVRERAPDIIEHLRGRRPVMPVEGFGGPWPEEWVALFERWTAEGCPRLELGHLDSGAYTGTRAGSRISLVGVGRFPTTGYTAWMEPRIGVDGVREYIHYMEPPVPAQADPGNRYRVRGRFDTDAVGAVTVFVIDSNGRHEVVVADTNSLVVPVSVDRVRDVIQDLGGEPVEVIPADGLQEDRFRLGADVLTVYSDAHTTEVEGAEDALAVIREAVCRENS